MPCCFEGHENWRSLDTSLSKYTEILNSGFEKLVMKFYWKNRSIGVTKPGLCHFVLLFQCLLLHLSGMDFIIWVLILNLFVPCLEVLHRSFLSLRKELCGTAAWTRLELYLAKNLVSLGYWWFRILTVVFAKKKKKKSTWYRSGQLILTNVKTFPSVE